MTAASSPPLLPDQIAAFANEHLPTFRELLARSTKYAPAYDPALNAFLLDAVEKNVVFPFDAFRFKGRAAELISAGGIEAADIDDLRRLLSAFSRQERFAPGLMAEMAANGVLVRVLERMLSHSSTR